MSVNYPTSPVPNEAGAVETDWLNAPSTSHLNSFKFLSRRDSRSGGPSEVWVRFDSEKKGIQEYHYSWYDHDKAEEAFQAISSAEHPGEVTWEWRRTNVPCLGPI